MRILHDDARCASTGICESLAPDLFEIGADGALRLLDPSPAPGLQAVAVQAVAGCPTGALTLADASPG